MDWKKKAAQPIEFSCRPTESLVPYIHGQSFFTSLVLLTPWTVVVHFRYPPRPPPPPFPPLFPFLSVGLIVGPSSWMAFSETQTPTHLYQCQCWEGKTSTSLWKRWSSYQDHWDPRWWWFKFSSLCHMYLLNIFYLAISQLQGKTPFCRFILNCSVSLNEHKWSFIYHDCILLSKY